MAPVVSPVNLQPPLKTTGPTGSSYLDVFPSDDEQILPGTLTQVRVCEYMLDCLLQSLCAVVVLSMAVLLLRVPNPNHFISIFSFLRTWLSPLIALASSHNMWRENSPFRSAKREEVWLPPHPLPQRKHRNRRACRGRWMR